MSFHELVSQERPPEEAQDRPRKDGLLGSRVLEAGPLRARWGSGDRGQDGGKTEGTAFTGVSRGKAGGAGGTRTIGSF